MRQIFKINVRGKEIDSIGGTEEKAIFNAAFLNTDYDYFTILGYYRSDGQYRRKAFVVTLYLDADFQLGVCRQEHVILERSKRTSLGEELGMKEELPSLDLLTSPLEENDDWDDELDNLIQIPITNKE